MQQHSTTTGQKKASNNDFNSAGFLSSSPEAEHKLVINLTNSQSTSDESLTVSTVKTSAVTSPAVENTLKKKPSPGLGNEDDELSGSWADEMDSAGLQFPSAALPIRLSPLMVEITKSSEEEGTSTSGSQHAPSSAGWKTTSSSASGKNKWSWVATVQPEDIYYMSPLGIMLLLPESVISASSSLAPKINSTLVKKSLQTVLDSQTSTDSAIGSSIQDFDALVKFVHLIQPSRVQKMYPEFFAENFIELDDDVLEFDKERRVCSIVDKDVGGTFIVLTSPLKAETLCRRLSDALLKRVHQTLGDRKFEYSVQKLVDEMLIPVSKLRPAISIYQIRHLMRPHVFPLQYPADFMQPDSHVIKASSDIKCPFYTLIYHHSPPVVENGMAFGNDSKVVVLDRVRMSFPNWNRYQFTHQAGQDSFAIVIQPSPKDSGSKKPKFHMAAWAKILSVETVDGPLIMNTINPVAMTPMSPLSVHSDSSLGSNAFSSLTVNYVRIKLGLLFTKNIELTYIDEMYGLMGLTPIGRSKVEFSKYIQIQQDVLPVLLYPRTKKSDPAPRKRDLTFAVDMPHRYAYNLAWMVGYFYQTTSTGVSLDTLQEEWIEYVKKNQHSDTPLDHTEYHKWVQDTVNKQGNGKKRNSTKHQHSITLSSFIAPAIETSTKKTKSQQKSPKSAKSKDGSPKPMDGSMADEARVPRI